MEKEELINHINGGLSIKKIAKITNKSIGSIRHWLKKYNLKTDVTGGNGCVYCATKLTGLQKNIVLPIVNLWILVILQYRNIKSEEAEKKELNWFWSMVVVALFVIITKITQHCIFIIYLL